MNPPVLELRDVHKHFPGVHALRGVSFDVRAGEVHALVGENGAGKSTLIKIMAGVHQPEQGGLWLRGQPVQFRSPKDAQAYGIDTIHQELSLYPELTVAENIFLGHAPMRRFGPLRWLDWAAIRRRAKALLEELDAADIDIDAKVASLNVGNRQRVEIAKALSLEAQVLIMDEPTAALTEADVSRLFRLTRLLRDRGVGIIYITHRLNEVFALAERVTVLRDGEYIASKAITDTNEAELIRLMVGRSIDQLFPKQASKPGKLVLELRQLHAPPLTREVSLEVRAGEIVGLAGLVGSGRSETAQLIFGIQPAQGGSILIDGHEVQLRNPSQAIAHGIAYVPEDRGSQGLIRPMNIRENVSLAVLRQMASGLLLNERAERQLAKQALHDFAIRATGTEQQVAKLSGGNQQKVVLSKWLASKPKLLIIDEPTRGVDVGAKAEIHRLISSLAAQEGLAILMISSELPEILGMSDRVYVMREGRIVAEFSRADLQQQGQEQLANAMMRSAAPAPKPPTSIPPAPQGDAEEVTA